MKMEILVYLFVISNINLAFAEEKETKKIGSAYEVHPEPEEITQNDQIAESSHTIVRNYGMVNNNQYTSQNQILSKNSEKLNGADVRYTYNEQNVQQQRPKQEVSLQNTAEINNVGVLQPSSSQEYNQGMPQVYLQQYPLQTIQILGAEALPLHQMRKNNHKTLGYSSYIEHVTEKDEEEIKSALKEGSVGDIKRLIPKSGISFQIYQTDKNVKLNEENQKIETEVHSKIPKGYSHNSNLQHRNKPEVPMNQFRIQTAYEGHQQPTVELEESQQPYLKNEIEDHQKKYTQNLLQSVGATSYLQDQQGVTVQTHHYTRPFNLNSPKTFLEANDKSTFSVKPQTHFKINVDDNSYSKTDTATDFNSLDADRGSKPTFSDFNNLQYQKQWNFDTKSDGSQKLLKNVKHPNSLQYDKNLLTQAEPTKELHYIENHGSDVQGNINEHQMSKSVTEKSKSNADINYLSHSYIEKGSQNGFAEHLAKKAYLDKETAHSVINRLSDDYIKPENVKTLQNNFISHLETSAYSDSQATKDNYREHFPTNIYSDSETAKSNQVVKSSFIETKNGQNSFDHQKALEGSTSFDIKNAIDSTGYLVHQTNYKTATAERHPFEDIQKQQFAYVIPKIPTSTVLISNGIQENSIAESPPIKDFGQAVLTSPHLSYQTVGSPEINGKFIHQPQAIMWAPEHLKQGNANNLHQPLIKLHLPKEEIYKFVETPNVEHPTSSVSHISYPQQKPYILHYSVPLVKHPKEMHFQPKTKTRIQNGQASHIKLTQPINIDWSLFKTTLPNYSTLALKPELLPHVQETGKKIIPILVRKRKNRSNNKETGIVYGKVNNSRRPTKPNYRQEKSVRINLLPEVPAKNQFEEKGERKNEFSVSASYKVDRSLKSLNSS